MPLPAAPMKRADFLSEAILSAGTQRQPRGTRKVRDSDNAASATSIRLNDDPVPMSGPVVSGFVLKGGAEPHDAPTRADWPVADLIPVDAPGPRAPATPRPTPSRESVNRKGERAKLFVLDTNVLLHDPVSLFQFDEHDVYLPLIVLEELDGHKKGMTDVARNARQISRTLDELLPSQASAADIAKGLVLGATGHKQAKGRLHFQAEVLDTTLPLALPVGKADNQILAVVRALRDKRTDVDVVLVTNDINMRVKARALGLVAEDYASDKALDDADLLYTGRADLPTNFWATHGRKVESWKVGALTLYRVRGPAVASMHINQFLSLDLPGEAPFVARVTEIQNDQAVLASTRDHSNPKHAVLGVVAKNREQNYAMNLLMDRNVDFVTLVGTAGSGKTLMALAAGLSQVVDDKLYSEIIMTRATIPAGEDIGFLPGNEEEKMGPWMGALDDNLEFLSTMDRGGAGEWGRAHQSDLLRSKVKIKSMNFMRGRTFFNRYVIVDEAQNLTPKQMKTLITRAGPGTKIVCLGNLAQIDTPYLTEGSSGLTYIVDRFKGWAHGGHMTLARGERSRLAHFANEVL